MRGGSPPIPANDWHDYLGDATVADAILDRVLHNGHVLKCGPRSWRTKIGDSSSLVDSTKV